MAVPSACGIPAPWGIRPKPPAVEAWNLNHGTAREVPGRSILKCCRRSSRQSTPPAPTILVQPVTRHLSWLQSGHVLAKEIKATYVLGTSVLETFRWLLVAETKILNHELQRLPELFLACPPWPSGSVRPHHALVIHLSHEQSALNWLPARSVLSPECRELNKILMPCLHGTGSVMWETDW